MFRDGGSIDSLGYRGVHGLDAIFDAMSHSYLLPELTLLMKVISTQLQPELARVNKAKTMPSKRKLFLGSLLEAK